MSSLQLHYYSACGFAMLLLRKTIYGHAFDKVFQFPQFMFNHNSLSYYY